MNATDPAARFAPRRTTAATAGGIADWTDEPEAEARGTSLVDLRRTWSAIRRSRLVIAAILGVALAAGLASILLTPPTYRARASVQIDQQTTRVLGTEDRDPAGGGSDAERFLQTQVDILRSRALAIRVAEALDLAATNDFVTAMGADLPADTPAAARRNVVLALLQGNLRVELPRNSRVVAIDVTSRDPALAARVANSYAEQFIASNIQRKFSTSAYSRAFLQAQLAQTKTRLEQSERALIDYARAAQLIDASGGSTSAEGTSGPRSLTTANLVELNAAFAGARSNRVRAQQRWEQAQATPVFSLPEVLGNPGIQQLTQRRAETQALFEQLRQRLKPDHPTIQQTSAQLAELGEQIDALAGNVRRSIRDQYLVAQRQETALQGSVTTLKTATLAEQDRGVRYNILKREADTNRQLYDGLLQRYKEVSAEAGVTNNNISTVDVAEPPPIPVAPRPMVNMALALLAGLGLAAAFVVARDRLDDVVRVPDDLEAKLGLPLLGVVPLLHAGQTPAEALDDPKSSLAEAHHAIRVALELSSATGLPRTMLVTSSRPGEGKSTTSWAIARDFAQGGRRTLLIDADLRKPSLHRTVGVSNKRGLSNLLASHGDLDASVQPTATENLHFLASGPLPPNPAQLLSGQGLAQLLATFADRYDIVVLDGPPVLTLADAPSLGAAVEGAVFVVEANGAHHGSAKIALRRLRGAGVAVLGGVMTKFDARAAGYGAESYYYNYRYYGEREPDTAP